MLIGGRREEQGGGPGFIYGDRLLGVIQLGSILCKKYVCKSTLIGKELPCILDDMQNEVNMSPIIMMNKATLT